MPKERTEQYIQAGNLFEESVLKWFNGYLDEPLRVPTDADQMERTVDGTPIVVHLDADVERTGVPVESKTAGLFGPVLAPWGESGTDEIPEYEMLQAHCHMMATDTELCHIPTFLGGRGFQYFFAKRDNPIVELIRDQAIRFWEENVLKDIPPADCAPTLELVKQIRRVEGDPVTLTDEMVQEWLDAKEAATAADKVKKFHQAEILATLDGHEMGNCNLGDITNFEVNRKGYFCEPTTYRKLHLKKGKK